MAEGSTTTQDEQTTIDCPTASNKKVSALTNLSTESVFSSSQIRYVVFVFPHLLFPSISHMSSFVPKNVFFTIDRAEYTIAFLRRYPGSVTRCSFSPSPY